MTETRGNRAKISSQRNAGGANFDVYEAANMIESYADGSSGAMIGPAVSKVFFHRVIDVEQNGSESVEVRERTLNVAMPTVQLFEFCILTVSNILTNQYGILSGFDAQKEALVKMITQAEANNAPKQ